jgi:hypothetical protein
MDKNMKPAFAGIIIAVIITGLCIGALIISYLPASAHAYGEHVGKVVQPGDTECALNGYYYPISSGKCTFYLNGTEGNISIKGTDNEIWSIEYPWLFGEMGGNQDPANSTCGLTCNASTIQCEFVPCNQIKTEPMGVSTNYTTATTGPMTYNLTIGVGGGGGCPSSGCPPPINWTAVEESAKMLGPNCSAFICGEWFSIYDGEGFYNLTGMYYKNGTPVGMTMEQFNKLEELRSNYEYQRYMNEKGYYYDGKKWYGGGL